MNKVAIGKQRAEKLESIIEDTLSRDNDDLIKLQDSGLLDKQGKFIRGKLAKAIGLGCITDTLRQNKSMNFHLDFFSIISASSFFARSSFTLTLFKDALSSSAISL